MWCDVVIYSLRWHIAWGIRVGPRVGEQMGFMLSLVIHIIKEKHSWQEAGWCSVRCRSAPLRSSCQLIFVQHHVPLPRGRNYRITFLTELHYGKCSDPEFFVVWTTPRLNRRFSGTEINSEKLNFFSVLLFLTRLFFGCRLQGFTFSFE